MIKILIGFDVYGYNAGAIFSTVVPMINYTSVKMENMIADDVYITEDTNMTNSTTQPTSWSSLDVLNCNFQNTLEGGSVTGNGETVTSVVIKNRNTNGLEWNTVATIPYVAGSDILFEYEDRYVQTGASYEYVLIPFVNDIQGITSPSNSIVKVDFDGTFLTDKNNNYKLIYDMETGSMTNNISVHTFTPLDSKYPIIQYGDLDYVSGKITCRLISTSTFDSGGVVDINQEVVLRKQLLAFIKNKQAKLLRTQQGEFLLCSIVDNPTVSFKDAGIPIASVDFGFVECGSTDSDSLKKFGL